MGLKESLVGVTMDRRKLDETVNRFSELPNAWKKVAVQAGIKAGLNSEVVTIFRKGAIKTDKNLQTQLEKLKSSAKTYSIVWVELGGQELVAIIHDDNAMQRDEKYRVKKADGVDAIVKKSRQVNPGAYRGGRYEPPRYSEWESKTMGADDAYWAAYRLIAEIAKSSMPDSDPKEALNAFIEGKDVVIKGLTRDEKRVEVGQERRAARAGDASSDLSAQSIRNRAIAKVVENRVGEIIDGAVKDVTITPASIKIAFQSAVQGRYEPLQPFDVTPINRALKTIADTMKGDVQISQRNWYGDDGKKLSYSMKAVFSAIEDIKS